MLETPIDGEGSAELGTNGSMHYEKCRKLAEIFSPERIGLKENGEDVSFRVWEREKSRAIFFSVTGSPCIKTIASSLELPEVTTRSHLIDLERAGFILRNNHAHPTEYSVSIYPFIKALGKEHNAILAMKDHFLSADRSIIPRETPNSECLHVTLMEVAKAFQNPERVKLYRMMRNQTAPMALADISKLIEADSEQAAGHALKPLLAAGLVRATMETQGKYTQREYVAVPLPFITVINDLNDEFGEGLVIDVSDRSKFFDVSRSQDEAAQSKFYEKTADLFKALRSERDFDTLRWYQRRRGGRTASERASCFESQGVNTEYTRIRKLKGVKLLTSCGNEGSGELLEANWKPLREAIYGLIG